MKSKGILALVILIGMLVIPQFAGAANPAHNFDCKNCHLSGYTITQLGAANTNLCLSCHGLSPLSVQTVQRGIVASDAGFVTGDASGRYNNPAPGDETSHHWAASSTNIAAGAAEPLRTLHPGFFSRYGATHGKVACSRCHDPHADMDINPKLLRVLPDKVTPMEPDDMCLACHKPYVDAASSFENAVWTHPLLNSALLGAVQNDPGKSANYTNMTGTLPNYNAATPYAGGVHLVDGALSCMSCHGVHFMDSNASTLDGPLYNAATGDGLLLRADGPLRTGADRNATAQLRSNLCQTCHTMELHGQTTQMIGCLDCHGGHPYNAGAPNAYILRAESLEPLPTRMWVWNGSDYTLTYNSAAIDFGVFAGGGTTFTKWADNVEGTAAGLCEQCHGDVNGGKVKQMATEHVAGNNTECTVCHRHNDPADIYSFNRDASAATCGQCHGFPPYLNVRGDRGNDPDGEGPLPPLGTDGGYAYNYIDTPDYDYTGSGHFKDETLTGHKVHAGADLPTSPAGSGQWYFVGTAGVDNCKVCHGPEAGKEAGGHRLNQPNTFRDVLFDGIAKTGGMVPTYSSASAFTCDTVYCHTNGAPYNALSRPSRDYSFVNVSPPWVGTGANYAAGGFGSIYNQANRCALCHGNDPASMVTKANTAAHAAHIGGTTTLNMGLVYSCSVCHVDTAVDADTLAAGSMHGRNGGKHVNGLIDVDYNAAVFGGVLGTSTYAAATGTCSTYCHDAPDPLNPNGTGRSVNWDVLGGLTCNSCHADQSTSFTGSHQRHVDTNVNGPKFTCVECHGAGSVTGTHAGHVNGTVDLNAPGAGFNSNCEECHGYDAGEVLPVWGQPATADCATCHAGARCGGQFLSGVAPTHLPWATTSGHNRPSGVYPQSENVAANTDCEACHVSDSPSHFDGTSWATGSGLEADLMLRSDIGFPAVYAGNEDQFCNNCHSSTPVHPTNPASTATRGMSTHRGKKCVACHNIHGDQNIQMIWRDPADQHAHDPSLTGKYSISSVWFTNSTDFSPGNQNSYDEDDNYPDGIATEDNADDICAVCHSVAAGTLHNNINNTSSGSHGGSTHQLGTNCLASCHTVHNHPTEAFIVAAGTACDQCHGYPPATGAHLLHSQTSSTDKDLDADRSDCALCHTGAASYTYSTVEDQTNSLNHSNRSGRRAILAGNLGYAKQAGNQWTCATACHNSDSTDGYWYIWDGSNEEILAVDRPVDTNGLNCNQCHYYAANPTRAGNVTVNASGALSAAHNAHFDKGILCVACHNMTNLAEYNNGTALVGPLTHIDDTSGVNEAAMYTGMAEALQHEAGFDEGGGVRDVVRAGMTFDDNNTCFGGITTGCHASGTPDWDIPIPATNAGCLMCHTNTTDLDYNPTSGLHNNAAPLPVTGNSHDGSFADGSGGTADCVTCHTASPTVTAAHHIDGTLQAGAAIRYNAAVMTYNTAVNSCTTSCHSAGTRWAYKWSSTSYNSDGSQCANCHGRWGDWRDGVIHRMDSTTQSTHGTGSFGCKDCHGLQAATGYTFTSGSADWNANVGETSNHGDGLITMNNNTTQYGRNGTGLSGCAECHAAYDGTATGQYAFVTTPWTPPSLVLGEVIPITCSSCHGGLTAGPSASNYWPDGPNAQDNLIRNNSGAHAKHLLELARAVYPLDIGVNAAATISNLLTDNTASYPALSSEQKQTALCAYCHTNPGVNPGHNDTALPAEVNSMYAMWDLTRSTPDTGVWSTTAGGTCATVDCHFNKATNATATSYGWYSGNDADCVMCHVDITDGTVANSNGGTHVAHMNAATLFGMTIACNDCHGPGAVAWDSNAPTISDGVAPTSSHIDGSFAVTGSVAFTYTASSCGTNTCHNAGDGVTAPVTNPYPWGTALADCSICHAAIPTVTAAAHTVHVTNTAYVPNSCSDCHAPATAATHIDSAITHGGAISAAPGNGSCTNTCHLSADAGDWSGGFTALACADCHSGTGATAYIGGDKSSVGGPNHMPTSGLHITSNVTTHNSALLGGNCVNCHNVNGPVPAANHANGTLENAATVSFSFHSNVVSYNSAVGCQAAVGCHSDGGDWYRKWTGAVDVIPTDAHQPGHAVCDNCHGAPTNFDTPSAWRWVEDANSTDHTDPYLGNTGNKMDAHGSTGAECETCHGWGGVNYNVATYHNNGFITMNGPASTATGAGYNAVTGGCAIACHTETPFVMNSSGWPVDYGDFGAGGGACDSCHGNQAGNYWPDGNTAGASMPASDDQAGLHAEHMVALMAKGIGQTTACGYCHGPEPGTGSYHMDGTATLPHHSLGAWFYKRIIGGGDDTDGIYNVPTSTCSTIDCHFNNAVTPHWYTDTFAPEAVTLFAAPFTEPGAIRVSWTAPGDDANVANTTAYVYDMRFGESAAIAENYALTDNHVGGLPITYLRGEPSEVIVEQLDPSKTYYFSLKTRDTAGNWSAASNTVGAVPPVDNVPPDFFGADKATPGDEGAAINLWWTAAEDHTMYNLTTLAQTPVTYNIWLKSEMDGPLNMDVDLASVTGFTGTAIELEGTYGSTTIQNNITYQLGVRACDVFSNCDSNDIVVKATPRAVPLVKTNFFSYVSNGGTTLTKNGATGGTATTTAVPTAAPGLTFIGGAQPHAVKYMVDGFTITLNNTTRDPITVTGQLGIQNGATFTAVTGKTAVVQTATRIQKTYAFKFADLAGIDVPANQSFAIRLTASAAINAVYGTAETRGDAAVGERIINLPPNPVASPSVTLNGAIVNMSWSVPADDGDGLGGVDLGDETKDYDPIHYDIYGSKDNGTTWEYVIAEELDGSKTSISWDTQADGIISGTLAVRIRVGDGFDHTATNFLNLGTANATDLVAPAAVTDLVALARPKEGTVSLRWTAPGDDYWNFGRAKGYDIRYSTGTISNDTDFNNAEAAVGEPQPDFGLHRQEFELTGLMPGTPYTFAIKTFDEAGNTSGLSNIASAAGGPRCGMCHATGPSVVESEGNHKLHGYTLFDCTKCHGAESATFGLDHQDGVLTMGYGPGGAVAGVINGNTVTYTDPVTSLVMYQDTDGFGGFGTGNYAPAGDGVDNGSCFNFGAMGVFGCHGPAGSDPDGAATVYPLFETPDWTSTANLDCGRCHGNPNRDELAVNRQLDPYGREYDGTLANAGVVPDQIIGSPGADNRGGWNIDDLDIEKRKYIGQHEVHLNYSFRFSKGDSCNLCHPGHYVLDDKLDGKHGDGIVDVELDLVASGPDAGYSAGGPGVAGTCFNMSPESCHPYNATPKWDTQDSFDCIGCHTMGGLTANIGHYTDPAGGIIQDAATTNTLDGGPMLGNCTWCHFAGHPIDDVGGTALVLPNNPQVGINYKSGGIRLRKNPGNFNHPGAPYQTQAQLCWGCHDAQNPKISEWGTDVGSNNVATRPANNSDYNYGTLSPSSNWTTATWSSGAGFTVKTGKIQSTHSTNPLTGSSAVTWSSTRNQWEESPDAVATLQCHNCHDVHNLNFAAGDSMNGNPYLRGSWVRNPYPEDGPPTSTGVGSVMESANRFMAVPRGGTQYNNLGGFQIDQNNVGANGLPPTAGLSLGNSAGLCTLCHGNNVDTMDYTADNGATGLWFAAGKNGHSNAALGGTAAAAQISDIFSYAQRNPSGAPQPFTANYLPAPGNPDMGYQNAYLATNTRVDGIRSAYTNYGFGVTPIVSGSYYAYVDFNWGVTQDTGSIDKGYHAFTCSKCHNPHASRLPKLLITNCLDTKHNTWDDALPIPLTTSKGTSKPLGADNVGKKPSNLTSAQNCHRVGDPNQGATLPAGSNRGWNQVTPWTVPPP